MSEKTIKTSFLSTVYEVESEPGDGTHYSYYAVDLPANKQVCFLPNNSEFPFPPHIPQYAVSKDLDYSYPPKNREVLAAMKFISEKFVINECAVLECLHTAQKLFFTKGAIL